MAAVASRDTWLPVAERARRGKAALRVSPRSSHGEWAPAAEREDPIAILEAQATTRIEDLVPIRYGRMLASPFAFYRGAAAIMAADLAGTPDAGFTAQLCGDAHLSNFGIYAAPDRRMVFDLNDFDETHFGPWEWDVKRLVASLEIAARDKGFKARQRQAVVSAGAAEYRRAMRSFAGMGNLEVWYARLDVERVLGELQAQVDANTLRQVRQNTAKARAKTSERALAKLTTKVDGELRFVSAPPLIVRMEDFLDDESREDVPERIRNLLAGYRRSLAPEMARLIGDFRWVDMARKVVGVGSVGTRAWIILLEGRDQDDPLVLQAKEAQASVLEAHVGPSQYESHGERVVHGQRLMQAASDVLLGWQTAIGIDGKERDFYVRQLWDGKGSAMIETMPAQNMAMYAGLCGWTLARAHARSGDRVAIASYLGTGDSFDRAMVRFAEAYAEQNEADHRALERAVDAGRLEAVTGL